MKNLLSILLSTTFLLSFTACGLFKSSTKGNVHNFNKAKDKIAETQFLGTKGSGMPPIYGFKNFEENTVESVRNGLNKLDGVEIDLQISSEGTFWVYENEKIKECRSKVLNFRDINNLDLKYASRCWHDNQLVNLDTMLNRLKDNLTAEKTISFDLKFLNSNDVISYFGGKQATADKVAEQLAEHLKDKNFKVLIELENDSIFPLLQSATEYPIFLQKNEQPDFSSKEQLTFPLSSVKTKKDEKIKSKTFQISGVKTAEDMILALNTGAAFIQTPNVPMGAFFNKMKTQAVKDSLMYQDTTLQTTKKKKIELATIQLSQWESNILFSFQLDHISSKNISIIFIGKDAKGHELFFRGRSVFPGAEYWKFINLEELGSIGVDTIKVMLSNRSGDEFEYKNIKFKALTY